MTWIAFEPADVNRVGIARVNNVPFWTTGSKCIAVRTDSQVRQMKSRIVRVRLCTLVIINSPNVNGQHQGDRKLNLESDLAKDRNRQRYQPK